MHPIRIGIPLVMIAVFVIYLLYLIVTKKESKQIKNVLYPGLFFIAVWGIIYFVIWK
jgi:FtsH-binding integral membrane protein